jgi:hypothetical protein
MISSDYSAKIEYFSSKIPKTVCIKNSVPVSYVIAEIKIRRVAVEKPKIGEIVCEENTKQPPHTNPHTIPGVSTGLIDS